jgi:hypothetical protein
MKKTILTLLLTLAMLASFSLAVSASGDGSSFDTAIQLPPLDSRTNSEYTDAVFDKPEQAIYFTFMSNERGYYEIYSRGSIKFDVYAINQNGDRIRVARDQSGGRRSQFHLPENTRGYIRVTPSGNNVNLDFRIMIIDGSYGAFDMVALWEFVTGYWWMLVLALAFMLFMVFFYRTYTGEKYGFDPLGGWFKLSMVAIAVVLILGIIGIIMYYIHWFIAAILAVYLAITSIELFVKSKNILAVIINLILMAAFSTMFVVIASIAVIIAIMLSIAWLALGAYGKQVGVGQRCGRCGKPLNDSSTCSCGTFNE